MKEIVTGNIRQLEGLVGANNHMGSKGTADMALMTALLNVLHGEGLFFLDSRTTARSAAPAAAENLGIKILERSTFLDNDRETQAVRDAVVHGLEAADRNGSAVMIGHVWAGGLAELLEEMYPSILADGYTFEYASSLLPGREDR